MAQQRAAREHGHCRVLRFEQPVERGRRNVRHDGPGFGAHGNTPYEAGVPAAPDVLSSVYAFTVMIGCSIANVAPAGSMSTANTSILPTRIGSTVTWAPNPFALATLTSMSAVSK